MEQEAHTLRPARAAWVQTLDYATAAPLAIGCCETALGRADQEHPSLVRVSLDGQSFSKLAIKVPGRFESACGSAGSHLAGEPVTTQGIPQRSRGRVIAKFLLLIRLFLQTAWGNVREWKVP
jgi:hypothetical protein